MDMDKVINIAQRLSEAQRDAQEELAELHKEAKDIKMWIDCLERLLNLKQ